MNRINRTGEVSYNKFGSKIIITNYKNCNDIDIYFPEYKWTKKHTQYNYFMNGTVKSPYEPRVYGVGYIGEGKYNVSINGKHTKSYKTWNHMLERCYDSKYIQKHPTYEQSKVHESWHNFQNFAGWFEKNYYKVEKQIMDIDKDILCKGNKIYSPDTCIFVPQNINKLFIKADGRRGDFPVGVSSYYNKKYVAHCRTNTKLKHLGYYDTPQEAFQVYKNFKEQYIKEVAEEYKNVIPQKLYEAMLRYEIEIDD